MKIVRLVIVSLALSAVLGSAGAVASTTPGTLCVAKDTQNLTPTTRAPDWYVPGVTGPFDAPLAATLQLPEGQSVAVQVPPALSGALGGLLQPATGALNGLTAGH